MARRKTDKADAEMASRRIEGLERIDDVRTCHEHLDDPFATFSEWNGEEDRRAYAKLTQQPSRSLRKKSSR